LKVAVFGGTGFIGVHTCMALTAAGHDVVTISRHESATPSEIDHRRCDAINAIAVSVLEGCDAVVNLIGIKRPRAGVDFEAAHVQATRNILSAMQEAGIERLVHLSVSASQPGDDAYLDTKYRAEVLVRDSDSAFTILRPAVVHGTGDDMIHHLVTTLRHAPFFPVPDGGEAELAVVAVEDVAAAVVACLERPESRGRSYDIVGPDRIRLRALVDRVAAATALPTRVIGLPAALMRPMAAGMETLLSDPPVTRAQLNMLTRGVVGDPAPARSDLGIEPRPLADARIAALADEPRNRAPAFGLSLRGGWPMRLVVGVVLLNAASSISISGTPADHWWRVAGTYLIALVVLGRWFRLPWPELFAARKGVVAAGLAGAATLFAATSLGGRALLALVPTLAQQASEVYAWADALPIAIAVPALIAIVAAEEIYWRAGVGFAVAEHAPTWLAIGIASVGFAVAHLAVGPPLLWLAALVCGAFWTWLILRTRSLVASLLAHLLWDVATLWLWPIAPAAT
jgi:NADH dehydrogenase